MNNGQENKKRKLVVYERQENKTRIWQICTRGRSNTGRGHILTRGRRTKQAKSRCVQVAGIQNR